MPQMVSIYGLVFVLNAAFGVAVFFFHALSDSNIRAAALSLWRRANCCR